MADGGMILNIDLDNLPPITQQVTFKGGKWRDRKAAQRDFKKRQQQGDSPTKHTAADAGDRPTKRPRPDDRSGDARAAKRHTGGGGGGDGGGGGGDRGAQPRWQPSRPMGPGAAPVAAGRPQNGVTSRLFTAIPEHTTAFDDDKATAAHADGEGTVLRPSNAPLSDEAATFLKLGLSRRIARQLSEYMALKAPTAIQRNALRQLVGSDSDAFLQAETGSGKTLAYLLPIVQRLLALSEANDGTRRAGGVRLSRGGLGLFAVVLAPTRELCTQIAAVLDKLLGCAPWLQASTVVGGENKKAEKARLRKGVNILVATPGRLTDHLDHTDVLDVSRVRWLVLDEGDRLMEMGFEKDIRAIVGKIRSAAAVATTTKDGQPLPDGVLPARRVTVLCSATMKMNAIKLGELTLEDAVHVTSAGEDADTKETEAKEEGGEAETTTTTQPETAAFSAFSAPSQLKQTYAIVPAKLRLVTLIGLLRSTFARKGAVMKAIVFLSCADSVDFHFDLLRAFGDDGQPIPNKIVPAVVPATDDDKDIDGDSKPTATSTAAAIKNAKMAAAAASTTASTRAPAAYITSAANRTVVLHKLHGSLEQPVRKATLASFRHATDPALLIATDIAARGLDVPTVDLVVEYDPAMAVDDHLHRIGRTARAGRAGSTTLFVQPGSEEGYVGFVKQASSSVLHPQLYDAVLQKGYAAPVPLPAAFTAHDGDGSVPVEHDPSQAQQSWSKRAEALQLHIEQRLLKSAAAPVATGANAGAGAGGATVSSKSAWQARNAKTEKKHQKDKEGGSAAAPTLLDAARQAFRSHIRAYATHAHDERGFFDMTRLHLGHMAKSFGLREAPGNMRGGVQRLAAKKRATAVATAAGRKQHTKPKAKAGASSSAAAAQGPGDSDDERFDGGAGDDEAAAARRMQQKMKEMMSNPAAEFNIG
ncbi:ATP-dependent RNA helicase DDX31/DBP7 [Sporothrix brasiliensis 5110]|uniref:ATP-dependent RNA helicase n=1 Tax=Sporothrix brasiliensis 5110 TaxID=1398154 RepID=A0A0C2FQ72_9PEZI|nr:ATP-dependent RNA helicase DDX31/DBP7 [Sporothrix brasiliensis 5110]KIH93163.1 ATP-dependent RNA helicase DDX31/DBP7 [Sporothrix brasiliensis 5110]